jgi:hypothetical protein
MARSLKEQKFKEIFIVIAGMKKHIYLLFLFFFIWQKEEGRLPLNFRPTTPLGYNPQG